MNKGGEDVYVFFKFKIKNRLEFFWFWCCWSFIKNLVNWVIKFSGKRDENVL